MIVKKNQEIKFFCAFNIDRNDAKFENTAKIFETHKYCE